MNTSQAYNSWSSSYDDVENKTRDLEAATIRMMLQSIQFKKVLELGCGTGKNTQWLSEKADSVLAVDFSEEMMQKAKLKAGSNTKFQLADISKPWNFIKKKVDLITCSLILEHIENLDFVFSQAAAAIQTEGYFYIGELHPFKQYSGSKARFETEDGTFVLECFVHHISDFINAAGKNGFICEQMREPSEANDSAGLPRIAAFLFKKSA